MGWWTSLTLPSGGTPRLTGSVAPSTSTGSFAVSPMPARSLAVLARAPTTPRPLGAPEEPGGSGRTLFLSAESVKELDGPAWEQKVSAVFLQHLSFCFWLLCACSWR